jgi:hypothetical protein
MAVISVAKTIRRMTRGKALGRWEAKVGDCDVTPEILWFIVKSFMKRPVDQRPTAVHRLLRLIYHQNEKSKVTVDYLESQVTSHYLRDDNYGRRVELTVFQAVLASVDDTV